MRLVTSKLYDTNKINNLIHDLEEKIALYEMKFSPMESELDDMFRYEFYSAIIFGLFLTAFVHFGIIRNIIDVDAVKSSVILLLLIIIFGFIFFSTYFYIFLGRYASFIIMQYKEKYKVEYEKLDKMQSDLNFIENIQVIIEKSDELKDLDEEDLHINRNSKEFSIKYNFDKNTLKEVNLDLRNFEKALSDDKIINLSAYDDEIKQIEERLEKY